MQRLNHIRGAGKGEKWSCKLQESIKQSLGGKMLLREMLTEKTEWDNKNQGRAK